MGLINHLGDDRKWFLLRNHDSIIIQAKTKTKRKVTIMRFTINFFFTGIMRFHNHNTICSEESRN